MTTFETVYNENNKAIYRFIFNMVRKDEITKELVNDTFLKFLSSNFNSEVSSLSTWLHNIAKNIVIDYYRSEKQRRNVISINSLVDTDGKQYFEFVSPETTKADSLVNRNEFINKIDIALDGLNPIHKKISTLYFIDEMKYNEIADICDISLNTVKGTINKCRIKLQKTLISLEVTY